MAKAVARAIDNLEQAGHRFAGMIADTVFSSDGIFCDPPGLLRPVADLVHARGGVFIADEVQPGFGRTGAGLWGFARHGIVPDIVTMGKPMGNGFPMGGVAVQPHLLDAFTSVERYFNTFGGNPVAAAAGMAVLDVIRDEGLIENARLVGDHLRGRLRDLATRHGVIGDVRGAGLYVGVELVRDDGSKDPAGDLAGVLIEDLRRAGMLVGAAGRYGHVLKIRPPLCFGIEHADMLADGCGTILRSLRTKRRRAAS